MRDVFALAGVGLIGGGCLWVYPPSALIVVGVLLLMGGVAGHIWSGAESDDSESTV